MNETVNLAMPFGLPNEEVDMLAHYQNLKDESSLEVEGDTAIIFTTAASEWSSIHTMCRCVVEVLPAGSTALEGVEVTDPIVMIKPWLWDFLQMSENAGGSLLPSKVLYQNIDLAELENDIRTEIDTNERYSSLTAAEKISLVNQFLNSEAKLLMEPESRLGLGKIETSGANLGKRRFTLQFYDYDNELLALSGVAEIFSLVGGRSVPEHPFTNHFSLAVWPNIAPVEGGIRFKVEDENFPDGTSLIVGGTTIAAEEIRISPDRTTVYATLPLGTADESVDVVVVILGGDNLEFLNAITYKNGMVESLRSGIVSLIISLQELIEKLELETEEGSIDSYRKEVWKHTIEIIARNHNNILMKRNSNGGGSLGNPELEQLLTNSKSIISAKYAEIFNFLT